MPSPVSGKIRWTIYLVFLATFFISAPIIVLYTAGYRYSLDANRVVHTGVLSMKSYPKGAEIIIDDQKERKNTPAVIKDLVPGEHDVRLEREGYTDWQKTLLINSQQTTFVEQAVLFLDRPARFISDIETNHYAFEPENRHLAYIQTASDWIELWIMELPNKDDKLLARLPYTENAEYEIDWSADGRYLNLITKTRSQTRVTIVNSETGETTPVSSLVSQSDNFSWDPEDGARFYVDTPQGLAQADIDEGTASLLPSETISATTIDGERVVAQEANRQTVIGKPQGETVNILAYLPIGDYRFHSAPNGFILLEETKRERMILLDATGGERPILLNTQARLWHWEPTNEQPRLLYSDGHDLHVYDPSSHADTILTRVSEPMTEVAWYPEGETVFYGREDGLYSIELDHRDRRNINHIFQGQVLNIWVAPNAKYAYIFGSTDEEGMGLFERRLQR